MKLSTSSGTSCTQVAVVSDGFGRARAGQALLGLALVMGQIGCLLLLVRLDLPSVDWSRPANWLENVPPEDAVTALVRAAALMIASYLVASTALYVLASLTRLPGLIRGTRLLTLPGVRRVVDGALAAAIVAAPAHATGIDLYAYITLTCPRPDRPDPGGSARSMLDRLSGIDERLPLRTVPLEVQVFTPTQRRVKADHESALAYQRDLITAWNIEMEARFTAVDLADHGLRSET